MRSVDFSCKVYHPEPPHAQSLFLFPIVFGINLIHFFDGKNNKTGQNWACAHYVMVSKFQRKPFWLATQRDPQNDWTATQNRVNYDVFAQAPFEFLSGVFDHSSHGSRHSRERELEQRGRIFLATESANCEFQRHNGETGCVKGETKSATFWQGKE